MIDYGDLVGMDAPEYVTRRDRRTAEMRARKDELLHDYDIIHGHFIADKYLGLFPTADFAAFFRDPYQQTISHYEFFLRHPEIDHPGVKMFHEVGMSLLEFVAAFPQIQSRFLGQISVEDLAVVGLTEEYETGIALFEAVFGCKIVPETARENVNPQRPADGYTVDAALRKAIDVHRAADLDLYDRARERFARLRLRYGV